VIKVKINVKLIGLYQTGRFKQQNREYPVAASVQDVIDELQLPQQHFGIVLVNGTHATVDTVLSEGDHLAIMPIIDGG
jgi:molybdopterin synthase sulfur carrier subunit